MKHKIRTSLTSQLHDFISNPHNFIILFILFIGTVATCQIAEFEGTARSTAGLPEFQLYDNASGENRIEGRLKESGNNIFLESLRGSLNFATGTTGSTSTRMTLNGTNGNVGIGTTSPAHKLDVVGDRIRILEAGTNHSIDLRTDGVVTDITSYNTGLNISANGTNDVWLQGWGVSSGNVYVGDSFGSTAKFSVNGAAAVKDWFRVNGNTDGTAWRLGVNGQSIFRGFLRVAQVAGTRGNGISFSIPNNNSIWEVWHGGALRFAWANVERSFISTNGSYNVSSDISKKKNIKPAMTQLSTILNLNPVNYEYKIAESKKIELGFIAQEVQKLYPEAVNEAGDGTLGVAYDYFAVLAIKGIQEQQEIIHTLDMKNNDLQDQIDELKTMLNKILDKK